MVVEREWDWESRCPFLDLVCIGWGWGLGLGWGLITLKLNDQLITEYKLIVLHISRNWILQTDAKSYLFIDIDQIRAKWILVSHKAHNFCGWNYFCSGGWWWMSYGWSVMIKFKFTYLFGFLWFGLYDYF